MKKQNTKKTLLISSIATFAIAGSATTVALTNSSNSINEFNKINTFDKSSRNISSNIDDKSLLKNPDQVLFISQDLPKGDSEGNLSESDIQIWTNFNTNLQNLINTSSLSSESRAIADQMTKMYKQISSVKEYTDAKKELESLAASNPLLQQALPQLIEQLKNTHIANGGVTSVDEISGIDDVKNNLLKLSGIVEDGTKIAQISNPTSFTKTDLTAAPGSSSINENISIGGVAGEGYQQLVKIAELDASQTGNYALSFEYSDGNSISSKGTIYIKNDKGQISSSTAAEMLANFDIFGRTFRDPDNTYGQLPTTLDNFVFQKNDLGSLEVLVRVKSNEVVSNIEFLSQVAGVTTSLLQPSKFGILNVQATNNTTFKSIIISDSVTTLTTIDNTNIAKTVQIFSDSLTSKNIASQSDQWENDRELEFYQVGEAEFSLPLYYALANSSNTNSRSFGYKELEIYAAGAPTGNQYKITLATDGTKPTILSPATYDMFSGLREQLPTVVASKENFEKASTITLDSMVDTTNKITKQTLKFSDFFYAIGSRSNEQSWAAVSRTGNTPFIAITDPTQKVFFEKPESFVETNVTETSTTKAIETADERQQVISILGSAYTEFSKSNSGVYAGKNFNLGDVSIWSASKSGSFYSNIKSSTIGISGSANDVYKKLNSVWETTGSIITQLFSIETNKERYIVSEKTTGKSIVENYLANKSMEFTSNPTTQLIETTILKAIEVVKKSTEGSISSETNFDGLTDETKQELGELVANLIKYQFGTIFNEIQSRVYEPAYDKIKEVINDTNVDQYLVIKSPSDLLETYDSNGIPLIKYKDNAWEEMATNQSTTLKEAIKSVFELIYFTNGQEISLGDSIFRATELVNAFNDLNVESLVSLSNTDAVTTKMNKVLVYNKILTFFGNNEYNIQNSIDKMLSSGKPMQLSFDIKSALQIVIKNISSNEPLRKQDTYDSKSVSSYYLDDVISGTNAFIALKWKLSQLNVGSISTFVAREINTDDLIKRINEILDSNPQASSYELSIWSNIIDGTYDYTNYTQDLSGRNGTSILDSKVAAIIKDENIMASRYNSTIAAEFVVEKIMKYLWWIIVSLVGVGILVSSSIGIATKDRQVKLSSRPILKWLLILGIILGIAVATLAILFGIVL